MTELILIIILLISLVGMGAILYRKIPTLAQLPETSGDLLQISEIVQKAKDRSKEEVKKLSGSGRFNHELFLQKILSKVRILTLKTENKTALWLERLRRKKNNHVQDDYWRELKKAKNGKKPA